MSNSIVHFFIKYNESKLNILIMKNFTNIISQRSKLILILLSLVNLICLAQIGETNRIVYTDLNGVKTKIIIEKIPYKGKCSYDNVHYYSEKKLQFWVVTLEIINESKYKIELSGVPSFYIDTTMNPYLMDNYYCSLVENVKINHPNFSFANLTKHSLFIFGVSAISMKKNSKISNTTFLVLFEDQQPIIEHWHFSGYNFWDENGKLIRMPWKNWNRRNDPNYKNVKITNYIKPTGNGNEFKKKQNEEKRVKKIDSIKVRLKKGDELYDSNGRKIITQEGFDELSKILGNNPNSQQYYIIDAPITGSKEYFEKYGNILGNSNINDDVNSILKSTNLLNNELYANLINDENFINELNQLISQLDYTSETSMENYIANLEQLLEKYLKGTGIENSFQENTSSIKPKKIQATPAAINSYSNFKKSFKSNTNRRYPKATTSKSGKGVFKFPNYTKKTSSCGHNHTNSGVTCQ